jgi:transposase-like protein
MSAKRRNFSAEVKVKILRRHLLDNVPVSDLCEEYDLHPTIFYRWQKAFFENGAAAFVKRESANNKKLVKENDSLKKRIAHKDEVIAEIMESHVALKKSLGET